MCIKTGFLITNNAIRFYDKEYYGVDTTPWGIDFKECLFYPQNIREEYYWESNMLSNDFVFLLNKEHSYLYWEQYRKIVSDVRLLYCICSLKENIHTLENICPEEAYTFLGYDYAYGGGDYYSAILNDIVARPLLFKKHFELNKNGLIPDVESMDSFIRERDEAERLTDNVMLFEKGDFVVYKLYNVL